MRKLLIVLAAFALVVAYTLPAMAADWGFYGSARMTTFIDDVDPGGGAESDTDLTWALQGNSRFGATVKAGEVGGGFEYGTGINLRKLYGTMPLGGGTLLVGQTYSPVNLFYSNQVWGGDTDMLNTGGVYGGRRAMLQYSVGSLKVALVQPVTGSVVPAGSAAGFEIDQDPTSPTYGTLIPVAAVAGVGAVNTNTTMPKIEASYRLTAGPVALKFVLGYNSYEEEAAAKSYDINSMILGVGFKIGFGAVSIGGNVYTGTNTGNYGLWQRGADDATYNATSDDIDDTDTMGYLIVVGFKTSDTLKFEAGYGYSEHESDLAGSKTDDTSAMYAQAVITMGKGCYIIPEIGVVDLGDNTAGTEEGDITYYGAKWQINF
jgi:hypothetical protein